MAQVIGAGGYGVAALGLLCVFCLAVLALALRGASAEQRPEILRALAEVFMSLRGRQLTRSADCATGRTSSSRAPEDGERGQ